MTLVPCHSFILHGPVNRGIASWAIGRHHQWQEDWRRGGQNFGWHSTVVPEQYSRRFCSQLETQRDKTCNLIIVVPWKLIVPPFVHLWRDCFQFVVQLVYLRVLLLLSLRHTLFWVEKCELSSAFNRQNTMQWELESFVLYSVVPESAHHHPPSANSIVMPIRWYLELNCSHNVILSPPPPPNSMLFFNFSSCHH